MVSGSCQPGEYSELLPALDAGQLWLGAAREQDWAEQALAVKWSGHRAGYTKLEGEGGLYRGEGAAMGQFQGDRPTPGQVL